MIDNAGLQRQDLAGRQRASAHRSDAAPTNAFHRIDFGQSQNLKITIDDPGRPKSSALVADPASRIDAADTEMIGRRVRTTKKTLRTSTLCTVSRLSLLDSRDCKSL